MKPLIDKGYGRFVLASSSRTQISQEIEGKSLYTQEIVEGLQKGAVALGKKWVSIADLEEYLNSKFINAKAPMNPQSETKDAIGQVVIAANPSFIEPIPQQLLNSLIDQDSTVRLGAITKLQILAESTKVAKQRDQIVKVLEERCDPICANPEDSVTVIQAITRSLKGLKDRTASEEKQAEIENLQIKGKSKTEKKPQSDEQSNKDKLERSNEKAYIVIALLMLGAIILTALFISII